MDFLKKISCDDGCQAETQSKYPNEGHGVEIWQVEYLGYRSNETCETE